MGIRIEGLDKAATTVALIGSRVPKQIVADMAALAYGKLQEGASTHSPRPGGTGNLRDSVSILQLTNFTWAVGHNESQAPYAEWVLHGSRPHVIRPRQAKALRWFAWAGGPPVFARFVNHPGYTGDNYLKRAEDATLASIAMFLDAALKKV